jgi:hypothetical protein
MPHSNPDHERFYQDNDGNWWYQRQRPSRAKTGGYITARDRAEQRLCTQCGTPFLVVAAKARFRNQTRCRHCSGKESRPGTRILDSGYMMIKLDHSDPLWPNATKRNSRGWMPEHRWVMARALSRPLKRTETIHHINGNKTDNRLENLQLRKGRHGIGDIPQCADCGSKHIIYVGIGDAQETLA